MKIIGIDPGKTTGWCIYDTDTARVLDAGQFPDHVIAWQGLMPTVDLVVIERPVVYHGSPPEMGDCCITAGILWHKLLTLHRKVPEWLLRREARKRLSRATHGDVHARDDKTTWQALKIVHGGEDSARKPRVRKGQVVEEGGVIGRVKSHERAALAVAVAWALPE